jgi:hypothetical protein
MDITLREYLNSAEELHAHAEKYCLITDIEKLEANVIQLQTNIRNIQAVAKRLADVSNVINRLVSCKKTMTRNIYNYKQIVDPYPTANDHAMLQVMHCTSENSREIVKSIRILTKTVDLLEDIPISPLYYVKSIEQYAFNINGITISGNLANIVDYPHEQSARCEYGIKCKSFTKKVQCKYYHDYNDWLKLKLPVPEQTRSFTRGSFLYTNSKKPSCYFTRHIGNKETILQDLAMMKSRQYLDEINNREGQLIHDLLIYLILHSKGLLEYYPKWNVKTLL